MSTTPPTLDHGPTRPQRFVWLRQFAYWHEFVLALLLAGLLAYAKWSEPVFLEWERKLSISNNVMWEIALLAIPMTLIIITAGIDLSVGSIMALSAVVLGMTHMYGWGGLVGMRPEKAVGLNIWLSTVLALITGTFAGFCNGVFIVKLKVHPLIVTLATLAAFKGIAEGISLGQGVATFPESFQYIGRGTLWGIPLPAVMFAVLAVAAGVMLIKTPVGRYLYAIGHNETATRFSGAPVNRYKLLLYTLSGSVAGLAAIIRVAKFGAKADAGDGMELDVITAVVLGGTSIFGGRGNILGTILGVLLVHETREFVPWHWGKSEYTKIVIGLLLIGSVLLNRLLSVRRKETDIYILEVNVKHLMALVAVMLAMFISSPAMAQAGKKITLGLMPKAKGNPYFSSVNEGAQAAAKELGNVEVVFDGPTDGDPVKAAAILEQWILKRYDVIAIACQDAQVVAPAMKKARERGIKVITFDADGAPGTREFFVNQATAEGIGFALIDNMASDLGGANAKGEIAIITGALTAANQNAWIEHMKVRLAKYPGLTLVGVKPSDDKAPMAFQATQDLMKAYPNLKGVIAITSVGFPAAADAIKQAGNAGKVLVTGLSTPNIMKPHVKDGTVKSVFLWNTQDLGYLTVQTGRALIDGTLKSGATSIKAGRLGEKKIDGDSVLLGDPLNFNKDNIDKFDF